MYVLTHERNPSVMKLTDVLPQFLSNGTSTNPSEIGIPI